MQRLEVSGAVRTTIVVVRRQRVNTASGIVLSLSDRPVCRSLLNLHTGRSLTESTIPGAVLIQFDLLMMSTELLEAGRGL